VRDFPLSSRLAARLADASYHDSYEAPLARPHLKMHEIYVALLGHLPWWARALIILRNAVVAPFGLHAESMAGVWRPALKDRYQPGDKIVRFRLYEQDEREIVAGRDDRHLDFRVSVLRVREAGIEKVILSTLVVTHNAFGRLYLRLVRPFHRYGLRRLIAQAVAQERI
jgi:Protein of unknown function (DUF2867)